ncbi:MAG: ferrous iron transporter B [Gemmatimonadales bacterium]|nr:ferrous iron transporter B [Gemmatimonadales bacterium]MYG50333.1 ferrous iron transporter B [Gemmatimonadales bacterium]MYK02755.1 ferrous iron transporter B [Candidatus Palauibacter ramosifaciens]
MPPVATPARAGRGAGTDAPAVGPPVVALIGPPNSGKTTLFNRLTGLRQRVANYPGVTVEKHVGRARFASGLDLDIVDLPGVSGFSARSPDERVTRDVLEGRIEGLREPEAIVLIVDAVRLETQLMLVGPVLERERPTILVLNMADELEAGDGTLDDEALAAAFGVEVVRTDARTGRGVEAVADFLDRVAVRSATSETGARPGSRSRTGRAGLPTMDALSRRREVVQNALAAAEYRSAGPPKLTQRLDALFLHRIAGPAVFLVLAALVFQAIFTWATPIMDGVELGIASSGEWLAARLPASWFRDLLIDGVWAGVGSVLVFLPQILILFLFLGLLEDSGYMARAAVIADRTMLRVGLQGRAFLPLLSAYACAVPAILSSRTVEDERDRMATMFIAPFMTCSARLPVYALLIAAFIPERPLLGPFVGTRAATMLGLYALGLVAAIGTAFLLRRTFLRGKPAGFVMELPPYRLPALRTVALRLLDRSRIFIRRVGKIILAVTIVLWVLAQFPRVDGAPPPVEESALGQMGQVIEPAIEPLGFDWRIGVGLVSSLAAREVIVGTLGTIYGIEDSDETSLELRAALQRDLDFGGAIALLVFFVFALQCMSTVAMMRRETAGWKWPLAQFGYMLALAYAGALAANQLL